MRGCRRSECRKLSQAVDTLIIALVEAKMLFKSKSRKSVRWSAVPMPCPCRLCLKLKGKQGRGPEGVDFTLEHRDVSNSGMIENYFCGRHGK